MEEKNESNIESEGSSADFSTINYLEETTNRYIRHRR